MTTPEMIQIILTVFTAIVVPIVALYVRSTVDTANRKLDDRLDKFELLMSNSMGDHRMHQKESEMRHDTTEKRIAFLENQWQAYQDRADSQQRFQSSIVEHQEAIVNVLKDIKEEAREALRAPGRGR